MSERSLVDYTLDGMRPYWDWPVKHADAFTGGIADLSGWLRPVGNVFVELKSLDAWPARARTPVKFKFEELQRYFIQGRRGWLWCRVRREYLLFDSVAAFSLVDTPKATQAALRKAATQIWIGSVNWKEFAKWLRKSKR